MKKILAFGILVLALFSGCQKSSEENKDNGNQANPNIIPMDCSAGEASSFGIIGGKTVKENSPLSDSLVLIATDFDQGRAFCTASLIGPQTLLTAAHCVSNQKKASQNGRVYFSTNPSCAKQSGQLKSAKFSKVIVNKDYIEGAEKTENDIALIRFETTDLDSRRFLELATELDDSSSASQLVAIGYGNRKGYSKFDEYPVRLRMTKFNLEQIVNSRSRFSDQKVITIEQTKSGVCSGDSGGPLIQLQNGQPKIIGIASTVQSSKEGSEACSGFVNYKSILNSQDWVQQNLIELNK